MMLGFNGTWCLDQSHRSTIDQLMARSAAAGSATARSAGSPLTKIGNVGVVAINGVLMKSRGWIHEYLGNHSTNEIEVAVRAAAADASVSSIVLKVESPGGHVAGVYEAAEAIRAAAAVKPTTAYVEDLGASGAYWLASQAGRIVANPMALVGSIGTNLAVADYSEMAAREGVKVHVVRAGAFKGMGIPGTKVTDAHLAELQRNIDATNEMFVAAVARGRRIPLATAQQLADGRVHLAAQAKALGLIDAVGTFADAMGVGASATTAGGTTASASRPASALAELETRVQQSIAMNRHLTTGSATVEVLAGDKALQSRVAEEIRVAGGHAAVAGAEWDRNFRGCRHEFVTKAVWIGYRAAELRGQVQTYKR